MQINNQVTLKSTPSGEATPEHFTLIENPISAIEEGSVLCETQYLSLDPYMRSQIAGRHISGTIKPGDVLRGETISKVVESKSEAFKAGDIVRCFGGWQNYSVHKAEELSLISPEINPASYALSALGMPGLTAYAGLVLQAKPKKGDVVVIPAATGAVGSVVGQLAKIYGCKVIGIAGSDDKCAYAINELGYDECINRKTENLADKLAELCPDGVDIYFDLIGGEMLTTVSEKLAVGARVILCGLMAEYNNKDRSFGPPPGFWIRARAIVYGLVVYDFEPQRAQFIEECLPYIKDGRLKVKEDVYEGLASAPQAFCNLMDGSNMGKVIIKVK